MNQVLLNTVTEYAAALEQKAQLEQDITRDQQKLRLIEVGIKRLADAAKSQASDKPMYVDIGLDRVVVVSSSILEICPLHQLGEKR